MPERTQLNINIKSSVLMEVKKVSRMRGVTIADFVTDCILKELSSFDQSERDLDLLLDRVTRIEEEISNVKTSCPGQIDNSKSILEDGLKNN